MEENGIDKIRERHADIPQEALPGVPELTAEPQRNTASTPKWSKIKQPRSQRPLMCDQCVSEALQAGSTTVKVAVALWRRGATETEHDMQLCSEHARPVREADHAAQPKLRRRTR